MCEEGNFARQTQDKLIITLSNGLDDGGVIKQNAARFRASALPKKLFEIIRSMLTIRGQ
jgi:hypothetical protein